MSTTAIGSASTALGATATATTASKDLGKDAFLKLLITQLQNQDPTNPVDNQTMIAQLAQFSSLEQLQGVGTRLDSLLLAQASSNQLTTAGLVGKDVQYRTDGVDLTPGTPATSEASIGSAATVTVAVKDATGKTVRTIALGAQEAGTFPITWDGKDASGNACPAGRYTLVTSAVDATGGSVAVETRTHGVVKGVLFGADGPQLRIGASLVKLADVMEISQP